MHGVSLVRGVSGPDHGARLDSVVAMSAAACASAITRPASPEPATITRLLEVVPGMKG